MISAFIRKSSSATTVGFSIFIVGFVTQVWILFLLCRHGLFRSRKKECSCSFCLLFFCLQLVVQQGFPYTDSFSKTIRNVWSLFPPNLFAQGIKVLSDAVATSEDKGISWSKRGECALNDSDCVITIVCNHLTSKSLLHTPLHFKKPFGCFYLLLSVP